MVYYISLISIKEKVTYAMNKDWQTVTENKQIQQSVTLAFFFMADGPRLAPSACFPLDSGVGGTPPSALSWFNAFVLPISFGSYSQGGPGELT
jgi:hypothetical protein